MADQTINLININDATRDPQLFSASIQHYHDYRHSVAVAHQMLNAIVEDQAIQSLNAYQTFDLIHMAHGLSAMNLLFIDSQFGAIDASTIIAKSHQMRSSLSMP